MSCSYVNHELYKIGKRAKVSLIIESAEPREVHHFALLFGFGASACAAADKASEPTKVVALNPRVSPAATVKVDPAATPEMIAGIRICGILHLPRFLCRA